MFRNLTVRRWLQGRVTAAVLCLLFLAGGPGRTALAQPNNSVFLPGRASIPSQKADLPSFMSGGSAVEPKGSGPSAGLPRPLSLVSASWPGLSSDFLYEPPDPHGAAGPNGIIQ